MWQRWGNYWFPCWKGGDGVERGWWGRKMREGVKSFRAKNVSSISPLFVPFFVGTRELTVCWSRQGKKNPKSYLVGATHWTPCLFERGRIWKLVTTNFDHKMCAQSCHFTTKILIFGRECSCKNFLKNIVGTKLLGWTPYFYDSCNGLSFIIMMYTEFVKSVASISWQVPSMMPAYHSRLWDLSSLDQYYTLGLSTLRSSDYHAQDNPYQQLSISLHSTHVLCSILGDTKLTLIKFTTNKRFRHSSQYPQYFFLWK